VAFKQKIPVLAGAAVLLGGLLVLLLLARPPAEDRLLADARRHASSLGTVRDITLHGPIADVLMEPGDRSLYLEFAWRGGEWVFVKDVGREFVDTLRSPEKEREVLNRLGQRLSDQIKAPVTLKEGLQVDLQVARDEYGLAGQYLVRFAFPKAGEVDPQRGRYLETYRYRDGRWDLEGTTGRLMIEAIKGGTR
jgi:hypothetical protein